MTTTTSPLSAAQREQFSRDGFVLATGLVSPTEAAEIRDAFMAAAADGPVAGLSEIRPSSGAPDRGDPLQFYPRMFHPHNHPELPAGRLANRYMLDPRFHAVLSTLMGVEPLAVQSMFYFKPPGARGQDLHQDNFYLRVKPGTCVAAWIALDDCDENNGGMTCVPGTAGLDVQCPEQADPAVSFTTERVTPPDGTGPVLVRMKPGDVLFFNGSTIHGSGPNTSEDRFRRSLIFHYVPTGTQEMSDWYTAQSFDGRPLEIKVNRDGGPCGTPYEATTQH